MTVVKHSITEAELKQLHLAVSAARKAIESLTGAQIKQFGLNPDTARLLDAASTLLSSKLGGNLQPSFLLRYTDGAYNQGSGERNGFPVDRAEATLYPGIAEARAKAVGLCDLAAIEDAETGVDIETFYPARV